MTFNEGMNDLPLKMLPPNQRDLERAEHGDKFPRARSAGVMACGVIELITVNIISVRILLFGKVKAGA